MNSIRFSLVFCSIISVIFISEALVCPDTSVCRDESTCCKWSTGRYGCCPLASAQCCSDGLHCCPDGTKCNNKDGTCDGMTVHPKWKIMPKLNSTKVNTVCPGGEAQCPDDDTCCPMTGGQWGCCPLTGGVCCPDHLHCCPSGDRCDASGCRPNND